MAEPEDITGLTAGSSETQLHPPPPPKNKKQVSRLLVVSFILGNEFCERLAYYGLATNLVIYLKRVMGYDNSSAALQTTLFEGTCYVTPLLGAWLADSKWGRYTTIMVSSIVYLSGMLLLAASAYFPALTPAPEVGPTGLQQGVLFTALYTICLGTGGIKPNVSTFGADQFDDRDPNSRAAKASFFNWFYFAINLGSLLAATVIVALQEDPNYGWAVGFGIPALAMLAAVVLFVAGSPLYRHVPPSESPMSRVVKVVWAALRNRWAQAKESISRTTSFSRSRTPPSADNGITTPLMHAAYEQAAADAAPGGRSVGRTTSFNWLSSAIVMAQEEPADPPPAAAAPALPRHLSGFTPQQVDEVKLVVRLFPVFLTTIMYWALYTMMSTLFVEQGAQMDRRLSYALPWGGGLRQYTIPAASLSIFDTVSIIVLIPVYDSLFLPLLRAIKLRITLLQRIGWGMAFSIGAMLAAAAVERARLSAWHGAHPHSEGPPGGNAPLGVLCQAPQYFIVGLSEVFTSIGQLEFFYDQAPDVMRSCSMALQLLSTALGSYLAAALIYAAQRLTAVGDSPGWIPSDLNQGRLDLFFLALAGMMTLNVGLFLVVAGRYRYKVVVHEAALMPVLGSPEWSGPDAPQPVSGVASAPPPRSSAIAIGQGGPLPVADAGYEPYARSLTYASKAPTGVNIR